MAVTDNHGDRVATKSAEPAVAVCDFISGSLRANVYALHSGASSLSVLNSSFIPRAAVESSGAALTLA
jgi:hypothetical protein